MSGLDYSVRTSAASPLAANPHHVVVAKPHLRVVVKQLRAAVVAVLPAVAAVLWQPMAAAVVERRPSREP